MLACILDGREEVEIVHELGRIREKHVEAAFSRLHAQGWPDQLRRGFGRARERGQPIGDGLCFEEIHAPSRACWELDAICKGCSLALVFKLIRSYPGHQLGWYAEADGRIAWKEQQTFRA